MTAGPAFEALLDWGEAEARLPFRPKRPGHTGGRALVGLRLHVRDHEGRPVPEDERTLEAWFGDFVFTQVAPGPAEALRRVRDVAYGVDPRPARIGPREARICARGPDPVAGDPDEPLPATVTWCDGPVHYLLASRTLSVEELVRIAGSVHTNRTT